MRPMQSPHDQSRCWYALVAAILAWLALGTQLGIILASRFASGASLMGGVLNFLSFFTVLTNILAAVTLTVSSRSAQGWMNQFFSRPTVLSGIAANIALVGIAYSLLLRHLWQPQGLQLLADALLHDILPALFLLYWLLFVPKGLLRWRDILNWALFPAMYLVYALLRGAAFKLYPYPFIDAERLGYAQVFVNSGGILVGFTGISVLLMVLDSRMGKNTASER